LLRGTARQQIDSLEVEVEALDVPERDPLEHLPARRMPLPAPRIRMSASTRRNPDSVPAMNADAQNVLPLKKAVMPPGDLSKAGKRVQVSGAEAADGLVKRASKVANPKLPRRSQTMVMDSSVKWKTSGELTNSARKLKTAERKLQDAEFRTQVAEKSARLADKKYRTIQVELDKAKQELEFKTMKLHTLERQMECKVCYDGEHEVLLEPCCHLVCCSRCSTMLTGTCPVCRKKYTNLKKVFRG